MFQGFFLIVLGILVSPKIQIVGFGSRGHAKSPEIIEMMHLRGPPKANRKATKQKCIILPGCFRAYLFHEFTIKMIQQWPPISNLRVLWVFQIFCRLKQLGAPPHLSWQPMKSQEVVGRVFAVARACVSCS